MQKRKLTIYLTWNQIEKHQEETYHFKEVKRLALFLSYNEPGNWGLKKNKTPEALKAITKETEISCDRKGKAQQPWQRKPYQVHPVGGWPQSGKVQHREYPGTEARKNHMIALKEKDISYICLYVLYICIHGYMFTYSHI